jgi:hypothetical protein
MLRFLAIVLLMVGLNCLAWGVYGMVSHQDTILSVALLLVGMVDVYASVKAWGRIRQAKQYDEYLEEVALNMRILHQISEAERATELARDIHEDYKQAYIDERRRRIGE